MGEITDALRRARTQERAEPASAPAPRREREGPSYPPVPPPPSKGPPADVPPDRHVDMSLDRIGLWSPRALLIEEKGAVAESTRHLALRIKGELERIGSRSLAVTSALRDEGKTTVSGNLAFAFASLSPGRTVALVDLDLRKPSVAKALGLGTRAGIDEVIVGEAKLEDVCIAVDKPTLDVYPVRRPRDAAHELLVRPTLEAALRELERRYEIVVVDTPPVLLVPDTTILLRTVGACVVVARAGHTRAHSFARMCELLPRRKILGSVLNEGQPPTHARSYGYYHQEP